MRRVIGRVKMSLFCMVSTRVVVFMRAYYIVVDGHHNICEKQTTDGYIAEVNAFVT